jgi:hypothetical protein
VQQNGLVHFRVCQSENDREKIFQIDVSSRSDGHERGSAFPIWIPRTFILETEGSFKPALHALGDQTCERRSLLVLLSKMFGDSWTSCARNTDILRPFFNQINDQDGFDFNKTRLGLRIVIDVGPRNSQTLSTNHILVTRF